MDFEKLSKLPEISQWRSGRRGLDPGALSRSRGVAGGGRLAACWTVKVSNGSGSCHSGSLGRLPVLVFDGPGPAVSRGTSPCSVKLDFGSSLFPCDGNCRVPRKYKWAKKV